LESLQNNLQKGDLFTNRPDNAKKVIDAMKSQRREDSTPSPDMNDVNDSTFIGDINELNVEDKL
jgi:hypothetical protein